MFSYSFYYRLVSFVLYIHTQDQERHHRAARGNSTGCSCWSFFYDIIHSHTQASRSYLLWTSHFSAFNYIKKRHLRLPSAAALREKSRIPSRQSYRMTFYLVSDKFFGVYAANERGGIGMLSAAATDTHRRMMERMKENHGCVWPIL